jgi:hypothetical protein
MISAFRPPFSKEEKIVVLSSSGEAIETVVVECLEATSLLKWKQDQHGNSKVLV